MVLSVVHKKIARVIHRAKFIEPCRGSRIFLRSPVLFRGRTCDPLLPKQVWLALKLLFLLIENFILYTNFVHDFFMYFQSDIYQLVNKRIIKLLSLTIIELDNILILFFSTENCIIYRSLTLVYSFILP